MKTVHRFSAVQFHFFTLQNKTRSGLAFSRKMKDKLIKGRRFLHTVGREVNALECKDDKRIKLSPAKISSLKFLLDLLHHLRLQLKKRWKIRRRVKKIKKKAFFSQEIVLKSHFFFLLFLSLVTAAVVA